MQIEPSLSRKNLSFHALPAIAYVVVHAAALYVFLTFAMATNGLEFFYFYPREAQTILRPFTLTAMVWLGTAMFSVFGLAAIGFGDVGSPEKGNRRRRMGLILGASILLTLMLVLASPNLVPFWLIGTVALGICWLGFGFRVAQVVGGRRELLKVFFASLLGIGAILETWSLGHWLRSGVVPSVAFRNVGAGLEMNLTYAASLLFPVVFVAAWLSPLWAYVAFKLHQTLKRRESAKPSVPASPKMQRMKLETDDLALALAITLVCVLIGFYAYFQDPSWLVGTDAYWRYNDPLERIAGSSNALMAAANERHGLYLLILYAVHSVTGLSPFDIVKGSPIVLATFLSVMTYFGVTYYRRNRAEGFFAGLFSATTFPTTLGIFASVDANWFAMIVALATVFLLVSLGQSSRGTIGKAFLVGFCGAVLLMLHPWTWGIIALTTLLAGLVFLMRKDWKMFGASLIVPLCGIVSGALVFGVGSETEKARLIETVRHFSAPLVNQSLVLNPFGVIGDSFRMWAPFLNPLLAILVAIGALFLVREKLSSYKTLVLSWMIVTGVGTFFAVTLQTEIWRIWYLQPLWLIAAAGVSGLLRVSNLAAVALKSNLEVVTVASIIVLSGLVLLFLEPVLGSWIFYPIALLPALFNYRGREANSRSIFAVSLIVFVSLFFLNHALRSLYPLILDPHNFLEH